MQFRNEFELHSSDSDYDTECSEENFLSEEESSPELANINLLSDKIKNKTRTTAELETEELETLHSKDESFPKGLGPLEELFDFNDVENKPKMELVETEVEEWNIGSELKPMMIKLSKNLPTHIKLKYIELFKKNSDVFAWSTLKIAETFPENPAVKAYAKKLCSGTVDVSYGGSTYQLHNILGDNWASHNETNVCGQVGSNIDIHLQTRLKRGGFALLRAADGLIKDEEVLVEIDQIEVLIEGFVEINCIRDL